MLEWWPDLFKVIRGGGEGFSSGLAFATTSHKKCPPTILLGGIPTLYVPSSLPQTGSSGSMSDSSLYPRP